MGRWRGYETSTEKWVQKPQKELEEGVATGLVSHETEGSAHWKEEILKICRRRVLQVSSSQCSL